MLIYASAALGSVAGLTTMAATNTSEPWWVYFCVAFGPMILSFIGGLIVDILDHYGLLPHWLAKIMLKKFADYADDGKLNNSAKDREDAAEIDKTTAKDDNKSKDGKKEDSGNGTKKD